MLHIPCPSPSLLRELAQRQRDRGIRAAAFAQRAAAAFRDMLAAEDSAFIAAANNLMRDPRAPR